MLWKLVNSMTFSSVEAALFLSYVFVRWILLFWRSVSKSCARNQLKCTDELQEMMKLLYHLSLLHGCLSDQLLISVYIHLTKRSQHQRCCNHLILYVNRCVIFYIVVVHKPGCSAVAYYHNKYNSMMSLSLQWVTISNAFAKSVL